MRRKYEWISLIWDIVRMKKLEGVDEGVDDGVIVHGVCMDRWLVTRCSEQIAAHVSPYPPGWVNENKNNDDIVRCVLLNPWVRQYMIEFLTTARHETCLCETCLCSYEIL